MSSTKSKHIDIKFFVVKEMVQRRQFFIEHLGKNSMVANPLANGLPYPRSFIKHIAGMCILEYDDI